MAESQSLTGRFIWHELLTKDIASAKMFYGALLGWTAQSYSLGEFGDYTMLFEGERPAAGFALLNNYWVPSNWTPFVAVESVAEAARAAVFWGGDITGGPVEIPGAGNLLMLVDDQGAAITVMEPGPDTTFYPSRPRVGAFCSYVLNTKNAARTAKFYKALFGWKLKDVDVGMEEPAKVFVYGRSRVGTLHEDPNMKHRAYWLCGIGVRNLPAMHQKAIQLGARSLSPPSSSGRLGSMNVLEDPTGATVCLYEPATPKR